jgi:hypothetical protein
VSPENFSAVWMNASTPYESVPSDVRGNFLGASWQGLSLANVTRSSPARNRSSVPGKVTESFVISLSETQIESVSVEESWVEFETISLRESATDVGGWATMVMTPEIVLTRRMALVYRTFAYSTFVGVRSVVVFEVRWQEEPSGGWSNGMIIGFVTGLGLVLTIGVAIWRCGGTDAPSENYEEMLSVESAVVSGDWVEDSPPDTGLRGEKDALGSRGHKMTVRGPDLLGDLDPNVKEWPSDDGFDSEANHRQRKRKKLRQRLEGGHGVGWIGDDWARFTPKGWVWDEQRHRFVRERVAPKPSVAEEGSSVLSLGDLGGSDQVPENVSDFAGPPGDVIDGTDQVIEDDVAAHGRRRTHLGAAGTRKTPSGEGEGIEANRAVLQGGDEDFPSASVSALLGLPVGTSPASGSVSRQVFVAKPPRSVRPILTFAEEDTA